MSSLEIVISITRECLSYPVQLTQSRVEAVASEFLSGNSIPEIDSAFRASPAVQAALLALGRVIVVPAGEVIFRQGSTAMGIYLILEGGARLSMPDGSGAEISFGSRTVGAGSVLGLPAVLCSIPYVFTARAIERCRISFIEAARLNEFLRERTEICMQVVQMMSRELSAMNEASDSLKTCTKTSCSMSGACRSCN